MRLEDVLSIVEALERERVRYTVFGALAQHRPAARPR